MKGICLLTKQRLGGFHYLLFSKSNLGESEVICGLASIFIHDAGSDSKGLDGPAQPTLHKVDPCEPVGYQGLTSLHQSCNLKTCTGFNVLAVHDAVPLKRCQSEFWIFGFLALRIGRAHV